MFADYHREADVLRINTVHHETWTTWIYKPLEINPESSCCDHRLLKRHKISWLKKNESDAFGMVSWRILGELLMISFLNAFGLIRKAVCCSVVYFYILYIFVRYFNEFILCRWFFVLCLWGKITISMEHSLFMRKRLWTIWTLSIWTQDKTMSRQCISICDCLNEVVGDECLFE